MGQEEAASGTHIVKEKQFLIFSDSAMVALGGFGKEDLVVGQLFLVGERYTVDALQRGVVGVSKAVGRSVLLKKLNIGTENKGLKALPW